MYSPEQLRRVSVWWRSGQSFTLWLCIVLCVCVLDGASAFGPVSSCLGRRGRRNGRRDDEVMRKVIGERQESVKKITKSNSLYVIMRLTGQEVGGC